MGLIYYKGLKISFNISSVLNVKLKLYFIPSAHRIVLDYWSAPDKRL